jgi:hypothetical protein
MTENERFGLVFAKTGSINSGTVFICVKIFEFYLVTNKVQPTLFQD